MRSLVVIGVLAASTPALAGHRACHEVSDVVGLQQCSRFGAGWSGATLAWELGLVLQRTPLDAIDRDTPAAHVTAVAGSTTATALRLRNLYNLTDHFYLASELTVGRLASTPDLVLDPVARETMPAGAPDGGWMFGGVLAVGTRASLGSVAIGSELAFGTRVVVFEDRRLPGVLFGQGGAVLEARAHAAVWLSMHWTANVMIATSVLEKNDVSITFGLGLHAFPFDGGR